MNKKRLVSLLALVFVLMSMVTVAFATGEAAPTDPAAPVAASETAAADTTVQAEGEAATGEVYWYHKVLAVIARPEVMIVLMIVLFYFILIRPENKRKKEAANMRNNLKSGDSITTIGGIVGKVVKIKDEIITIETGEDNKLCITKWAVSSVEKADKK